MTWWFAHDKCYCSENCRQIFVAPRPWRGTFYWRRAYASFWRNHGAGRKKKRVHNKAVDAVDAAEALQRLAVGTQASLAQSKGAVATVVARTQRLHQPRGRARD